MSSSKLFFLVCLLSIAIFVVRAKSRHHHHSSEETDHGAYTTDGVRTIANDRIDAVTIIDYENDSDEGGNRDGDEGTSDGINSDENIFFATISDEEMRDENDDNVQQVEDLDRKLHQDFEVGGKMET